MRNVEKWPNMGLDLHERVKKNKKKCKIMKNEITSYKSKTRFAQTYSKDQKVNFFII